MLELLHPHRAGIRQLTVRNLLCSKSRCVSAIAGVALSVFLMLFQGSLFVGFLRAAGKVILASEAEVWMMPRGVCAAHPKVIQIVSDPAIILAVLPNRSDCMTGSEHSA